MTSKAFDNVAKLNSLWVSVKEYGAKGDGVTNDTDAFLAASAAINAASGGTLFIPPGLYIVGKQNLAGATGKGFSWGNVVGDVVPNIIDIKNCTRPVVIEGNGAILKIANGLRYGSFNPVTGAPTTPALPTFDQDLRAHIGEIIDCENNVSVTIRNLELDGNITNAIIGGNWGVGSPSPEGIQNRAGGIRAHENDLVLIENVYAHHNGLDGFEIKHTVTSSTQPQYPHTIINCRGTYNGRQGLSWVGGNHLTCMDCDFSHTGRTGVLSVSNPGAGIDIEPETSIGRNGTFINVRCFDNVGVGMVADQGDSADMTFISCQFIGTTQWSSWVIDKARYRFTDCLFVGPTAWVGGDATNPENAAKYSGCKFVMDPAYSPSGTIYAGTANRMEFSDSRNVVFSDCVMFSASGYTLPFSIGGADGATYNNCYFEQVGAGTSFTRGQFIGRNRIVTAGTFDQTGSIFFGLTTINGTTYNTISLPEIETLPFRANNSLAGGKLVRYVVHYDPLIWAAAVGGAVVGDVVFAPNPTAGNFIGSVCTSAGNPGTWKTFGAISA